MSNFGNYDDKYGSSGDYGENRGDYHENREDYFENRGDYHENCEDPFDPYAAYDDPFEEEGEPMMLTLCMEEETILVSRAILEALEFPKQIQMLINDERGMLLLKSCTVHDREAVVIPQQPMLQFEVSGASLLRRVRRLTGWADDCPRVMYGNYLPQHRAIVFELSQAQPAELRIPIEDIERKSSRSRRERICGGSSAGDYGNTESNGNARNDDCYGNTGSDNDENTDSGNANLPG